jgi:hypothetical protein
LQRLGQQLSQADRQVGAPEELDRIPVLAGAFTEADLVQVAGARIEVPLALEGGALQLPAGLPPLALPEFVPCAPTETAVHEDRIELSCEVTGVPVILE